MILFAQTFPRQKLNYSKTRLTLFLGVPIIISILALIPNAVIDSVVIIDQSRYIAYGPLYPLYFAQISLYFCIVIYVMIKKYLILQGRERNQVEITFLTLIVGSLVGVFTSLIMPTYGDFSLFWAG
jgi:hypothetical protein